MITIRAWVTGGQAVSTELSGLGQKTSDRVRAAIKKAGIDLQSYVIREKLSGNPLNRVTGDLSRSVYVKSENDGLTAVIGANTPYAARQEYGFTGIESVRSFVRRSRAQMAKARYNKLGLETRPSKARGIGTGEIVVNAFSRNVDYPAHSYLRSSLNEMRQVITENIVAAALRK